MYLVISLLVLRAGCGIWLYQFLIIAYLFTLNGLRSSRRTCASTQRGQRCDSLSKVSSKLSEQWRLWRDCADAHARLSLRCSPVCPFLMDWLKYEPAHDKVSKLICAPSKYSDQPGRLISLRCMPKETLTVSSLRARHFVDFVLLWLTWAGEEQSLQKLSHVTRKPFFRVCDQARDKSACSATEARFGYRN